MTKFVLEILDGDQKGDSVSLGEERITIGRKPSNALVLSDEKCSGQHAEIVFEDGGYVLRDLESRNGTLLDGRKVTEIALSPFDTFQIGRTRVVFKEEGKSAPDDGGLQLDRLDAAMMAKAQKGKRSLATMLVVVLVLLAAGAGAWFKFVYVPAATGGGEVAKVVRVTGNKLDVGEDNFEGEDFDSYWSLKAAGAGFDLSYDHVNSGEASIEAVYVTPDEGSVALRYALCRSQPIQVSAGSKLRLTAHAATSGGGRAAIRARITSKSGSGSEITTGTTALEFEEFTATEFVVQVPRGLDRIEIELLALLPSDGASVRFDDICIVDDRDAEVQSRGQKASDGHVLSGAGADVGIALGEDWALLGVLPLVSDPVLKELAAARLLTASDAGLALNVEAIGEAGFNLSFEKTEGSVAEGLVLAFPYENSAVLGRADDGDFLSMGPELAGGAVREMLLGSGRGRCLVGLPEELVVSGKQGKTAFLISLPNTFACSVSVVFTEEGDKAREHNRKAAEQRREGHYAAALDELTITLHKFPHNDREANAAQQVRNELMAELSQEVADLRQSGSEASFFDSKVGYDRIGKGTSDLIAKFGRRHITQIEELDALVAAMKAGSKAIEVRNGEAHRTNLRHLAEVFDENGQKNLSTTVRAYIEKHYGLEDASTSKDGALPKTNEGGSK